MNRERMSRRGDRGRGAEASPSALHRTRGFPLAAAIPLALTALLGCAEAPESQPASAPVAEAESALGSTPTVCVKLSATDAHLSAEKSTTNYGTSSFAISGASTSGVKGQFAALFQFDTSGIPVNATVVSAAVSLSQTSTGAASPGVHRVTAPWSAATVTWASLGGAYAPAPFTSFSLTGPTITFNIAAQAQDWVSHAVPNYGIYIEQNSSKFQTKYKANDYPVASLRPALDLCYKVLCPTGFADCNNSAADGCETDLSSLASCGACGNTCSFAHAGADCTAGACTMGACDPGFGDCNGDPADGCEASLAFVPGSSNCGACGVSCPACSGLLGLLCPDGLSCIDYAGDGCDPNNGGSDCIGLCVSAGGEICPQYCGGIAGFECPAGLLCSEVPLTPGEDALSLCIPATPCNSIGSYNCPSWLQQCQDDPTDSCDPAINPGCPGLCLPWFLPDLPSQLCGGTANIGCPVGQICQDIPCDGCNPVIGALHCKGTCAPDPNYVPPLEQCPYYCGGFAGFTCPVGLLCSPEPLTPGEDALSLCLVSVPCAGIGTFSCPNWFDMCTDDPTDACDASINPSCPGLCLSLFDTSPTFCGGVMGLGCPAGQSCHDIPCDGCIPQQGGVDCMGACGP